MGDRGGGQGQVVVSKPNVATGRTANASHKGRQEEAMFVCPMPGWENVY